MSINDCHKNVFEICFMFIDTDTEHLRDTVGKEKIIAEIKEQLKSYAGKNKNFSSLIFIDYVSSKI